jgi:hypothetical protein
VKASSRGCWRVEVNGMEEKPASSTFLVLAEASQAAPSVGVEANSGVTALPGRPPSLSPSLFPPYSSSPAQASPPLQTPFQWSHAPPALSTVFRKMS